MDHEEIFKSLGRIEAKLDATIDRLDQINGKVAKHDKLLNGMTGVILASPFLWWAFNNIVFNNGG